MGMLKLIIFVCIMAGIVVADAVDVPKVKLDTTAPNTTVNVTLNGNTTLNGNETANAKPLVNGNLSDTNATLGVGSIPDANASSAKNAAKDEVLQNQAKEDTTTFAITTDQDMENAGSPFLTTEEPLQLERDQDDENSSETKLVGEKDQQDETQSEIKSDLVDESYKMSSDRHFIVYFLVGTFLCIGCYLLYQSRRKIVLLVIKRGEGKESKPRTKDYQRLDANVSEAMLQKGSGKTYMF